MEKFFLGSMVDASKCFSTLNYIVLTIDNYLEEDCKRISL